MTQRHTFTVQATVPVRITMVGITTQTPEQAVSMADAMLGEAAPTLLKHQFGSRGDELREGAKIRSTNPQPQDTRHYSVDPSDGSWLDLSRVYTRREDGVLERTDHANADTDSTENTPKPDPERAQQLRDEIHQLGFDSLVYFSGDRRQECWSHPSGAYALLNVAECRILKFATNNGLVETSTGELGWPNRNLPVFAKQVITVADMAL